MKILNSLITAFAITGAGISTFEAHKYGITDYFYEKKIAKKEVVTEAWSGIAKPLGKVRGFWLEYEANVERFPPYLLIALAGAGVGASIPLGVNSLINKIKKGR